MAFLAQYSHALHTAPAAERPRPGSGSRWFGYLLYAGIAALVVVAALASA